MALYTETFTAGDAASLTADQTWATVGTQVLGITSNQAAVQTIGAVTGMARMEVDSATPNHFMELPLTVWTPQALGITHLGCALRFSASADSSYNFYADEAPIETSFSFQLVKRTAGSNASLGNSTAVNPTQGQMLRFEATNVANGVQLRCYVNDALIINVTDTSSPFTTQTRCGIRGLKLLSGDAASTTAITFGDLVTNIRSIATPIGLGVFRA